MDVLQHQHQPRDQQQLQLPAPEQAEPEQAEHEQAEQAEPEQVAEPEQCQLQHLQPEQHQLEQAQQPAQALQEQPEQERQPELQVKRKVEYWLVEFHERDCLTKLRQQAVDCAERLQYRLGGASEQEVETLTDSLPAEKKERGKRRLLALHNETPLPAGETLTEEEKSQCAAEMTSMKNIMVDYELKKERNAFFLRCLKRFDPEMTSAGDLLSRNSGLAECFWTVFEGFRDNGKSFADVQDKKTCDVVEPIREILGRLSVK